MTMEQLIEGGRRVNIEKEKEGEDRSIKEGLSKQTKKVVQKKEVMDRPLASGERLNKQSGGPN